MSTYKNDVFYNASVDCFFERLNASKVLLIKEPLEALDECKNASCYDDVGIDVDLAVDEIAEQMKKCLDSANATGPLYDELLNVINYCNISSKKTIEELIEKLKSDNNETIRKILHQIIELERKSENDGSVEIHPDDSEIDAFVLGLLS